MTQRTYIIAPPPTPNGDLHVGHLSGPYLAADIYRRHLAQNGIQAAYVISTDDHQTYVDTTAARLGMNVDCLVETSRSDIANTLRMYSIGIRSIGVINSDYKEFVTNYFRRILDEGLITVREMDVLHDARDGTYPVEAYVSGMCPICLAECAGGICEDCGEPNCCGDLLNINVQQMELRREPRLVLDLEPFRAQLEVFHSQVQGCRPALKRLVAKVLSRKLRPFVLSYRTGRGVSAAFAGLRGQQLNVWGEMYPGHMYFLQQEVGPLCATDVYLQFFGFDNSYFYAIVHVALMFAARRCGFDWPAPAGFVTNQFYSLESSKFSTSRGHLIWAKDLAREINPDVIRLYLALHGPEYQEASFVRSEFDRAIRELVLAINRLIQAFNLARTQQTFEASVTPVELIATMATFSSLKDHSSAVIARRSMNCIKFLERSIASGRAEIVPFVPRILVRCLEVFCPRYTDEVRESFRIADEGWNDMRRSDIAWDLPKFSLLP